MFDDLAKSNVMRFQFDLAGLDASGSVNKCIPMMIGKITSKVMTND